MEEYDDSKDQDFNPVYCDQTLSDVESEEEKQDEEEDKEDEVPEMVELKDNSCMFKVENMKIPPMEADFNEEEEEHDTMEDWSESGPNVEF